jgi:hypothetical protein
VSECIHRFTPEVRQDREKNREQTCDVSGGDSGAVDEAPLEFFGLLVRLFGDHVEGFIADLRESHSQSDELRPVGRSSEEGLSR